MAKEDNEEFLRKQKWANEMLEKMDFSMRLYAGKGSRDNAKDEKGD